MRAWGDTCATAACDPIAGVKSLLDQSPKALCGLVPLSGCPLKILACFVQSLRADNEVTFSADPFTRYDARLFENSQMLGHPLSGESSALRELRDRLRTAVTKPR